MLEEIEEKAIEDDIVEKVVENKVHPLKVSIGVLQPGKKLKAVIAGSKGSLLEIVAPDDKILEYTVSVAVRERNVPKE